ncbi:hypothetical protein [Deinococcus sp.]|uniref:hypothetical protein n=1 Tax=Deinococcus sp. TaxID=47478 RepID=UPI003B5BEFC7
MKQPIYRLVVLRSLALGSLVLGSALAQTSPATSQGKTELIRGSLEPGVERLIAAVQDAVTASGGDLERMRADWVIAFSTGHYKSDPLGAQAAREVATQLVQREAVSTDTITARAWELNVWDYRNPSGLTLQIGTDMGSDKARVDNLWPTTPAVGSVGGHDTEQAAATLIGEQASSSSAIIILLTNTAASVGAAGNSLLGTNAPAYQDALQNYKRLEGSQDGATLNLPYRVSTPGGEVPGQMQAVIFVPKTFTAAALTPARSQQLAAPATAAPARSGGTGLVLGLLGLVLLGALAWFFLGRNRSGGAGPSGGVRVGDSEFALRGLPAGRPFCVIAGPGYASEDDLAVVPVQGLPAARIAELSRVGREIKVRSVHEDVRLSSIGGQVVVGDQSTFALRPDQPDTVLEFSGEVRGGGGVPKNITKTLTVSIV